MRRGKDGTEVFVRFERVDGASAVVLVDSVQPFGSTVEVLGAGRPVLSTEPLVSAVSFSLSQLVMFFIPHVRLRLLSPFYPLRINHKSSTPHSPRETPIFILLPLYPRNLKDRLQRLTHPNDGDGLDECFPQPSHQVLALRWSAEGGEREEVRVELAGEVGMSGC